MKPRIMCAHNGVLSIEELKKLKHPSNENVHSEKQLKALGKIIEANGQRSPIVISKLSGKITKGHGRVDAMDIEGFDSAAVDYQEYKSAEEEFRDRVADNEIARYAEFNDDQFKVNLEELELDINVIDLETYGLLDYELDDLETGGDYEPVGMVDQFLAPPFSIIDARQGYWQNRKRAWLGAGIKSEEGRDAKAFTTEGRLSESSDTSVFDPALTELMYTWFSCKEATIIDPFAGGSVRGVVASLTGRQYIGHELRREQVEANRKQGQDICSEFIPVWHIGDSRNIDKNCSDVKADFLFSCPPYADLEVYSSDESDISNMDYPDFLECYREIIRKSCTLLKEDSFAAFVVGDVRDKNGNYYNFVSDTISAFIDAGLSLYNEIIYITPTGSLPMRAGKSFKATRKVGKAHQNILIFVKGDAKKATLKCGAVEILDLGNDDA